MQHCNVDVWDGSPAFINFSTSQFTEVLERCIHEEVHVNHNQVQPLLNYHHCSNHYYDPLPEIDKRLWLVEQWILLSKKGQVNHVFSMMTILGKVDGWIIECRRPGSGQKKFYQTCHCYISFWKRKEKKRTPPPSMHWCRMVLHLLQKFPHFLKHSSTPQPVQHFLKHRITLLQRILPNFPSPQIRINHKHYHGVWIELVFPPKIILKILWRLLASTISPQFPPSLPGMPLPLSLLCWLMLTKHLQTYCFWKTHLHMRALKVLQKCHLSLCHAQRLRQCTPTTSMCNGPAVRRLSLDIPQERIH